MPPKSAAYVPALGFHWLTPFYDVVVGRTTRERTFKRALIRQAAIGPDDAVLDLACGTGTLAVWIKDLQPAARVTGVDGDDAVLARARANASRRDVAIDFDQALSTQLPYPDACFDRVLSSLFFHHLTFDDKRRTAQELFRVLKPSAQLHVADWGRPTDALMRMLFLSIQLLDGFPNTRDNVQGKLPEVFRQAGFDAVTQTTTFSTIYGTMALYRAVKPPAP